MQDLASQIRPTVRVMDNKNANAVDMQENELNKKKRNSYADSPHRLVCPYCPRAFPWISSLNRHILTHTGKYNNIITEISVVYYVFFYSPLVA